LSGPLSTARTAVSVWDPLVRVGHWSLVASIAAAWFTREGFGVWHERIGYAALAIVCVRVVWGFAGPHYARFKSFVRSPAATLDYARRVATASEPRHLGHNPLGGWMIVMLLAYIMLVCLSGWLYTTDRYWGVEWIGELHETLTHALLVLIALHVGGVALASFRHRENLVAAMVHGRKREQSAEQDAGPE
jgi:cytochrome b